ARDRFVVHRHLDERRAVERQLESLAHARVAARRAALAGRALADVEVDALVTDLDDARDLEAVVALQVGHVGSGEALDEVELARAQVREAHRRIDDRLVDDAVEVDLALVPVTRIPLEDDAVLRDAL